MSELSIDQIAKLFSTLEANPKLQAQFSALMGVKSPETEHPAPSSSGPPPQKNGSTTAQDLNSGNMSSNDMDKSELDPTKKQDVTDPSDILAFLSDFALPRHIPDENNSYVPNFNGMLNMIHEMNQLVAQKFRAQRAHMAFDPHLVIFFYLWLANLQVARCLKYANQLDNLSDISALDTFLSRFPSDKFPIPGPLLPYFKALTTYKIQNALHSRVSPRFPQYYLRQDGTHKWNESEATQLFPYLPAVHFIYSGVLQHIKQNKTAPDYSTFYPGLTWSDPTAHTANDDVNTITLLGVTVPQQAANAWTKNQIAIIVNPAHHRIPIFTDEMAKKAAPFLQQVTLPVRTNQANSLQSYLGISDPKWLKTILRYMSEFSALWKGSGSLADASPDGPAFGAYISKYEPLPATSAARTAPAIVNKDVSGTNLPYLPYYQQEQAFDLISQVYTTQGAPEPLVERLSAITQIHAKLPDSHWDVTTSVGNRRFGNVWSISPLYGPSSSVYFYDTIEDYVEKNLQDKLKQ